MTKKLCLQCGVTEISGRQKICLGCKTLNNIKYCKICGINTVSAKGKKCISCSEKLDEEKRIANLKYCSVCSTSIVPKKGQKCNQCKSKIAEDLRISKMKFCSCGVEVFNGSKKCNSCKDIEKRTITCSCGTVHVRKIGYTSSKCQQCRAENLANVFCSVKGFFDPIMGNVYGSHKSMSKRIRSFAGDNRNAIKEVTRFPEFIMPYRFKNVPKDAKCADHINGMLFTMENYLHMVIDDPSKLNMKDFKRYIKRYGVKFMITQAQNLGPLKKFQKTGVSPSQYISIVGEIRDKTFTESVDIIKYHFIKPE